MKKTTKTASNIMQPESLEEPIEQPNPKEVPQSDQLIEPQFQVPKPPEGQLLSPNERVNAAYKLVYGEGAEIPIRHESIDNERDADWFVRSYMGILFATRNDNPLSQKFSNLDELLTWFYQVYPLQQEKQGE
ncbi:hypothetical protein [Microcoleus sp. Pol12B5]|uniref:hypothetical protein n=1 Tax=Microcoleus sp. Pol12B5 TaxID=3055396 RepID=UPI002FD5F50E